MGYECRCENGQHVVYAGGHCLGRIRPCDLGGVIAQDDIRPAGDGVFAWTRKFTARTAVPAARLTLEFEAAWPAEYVLIPAVGYNGNAWGSGDEPKGFERDGVPWTFAWHRTSVPGATYSEGRGWSVALFRAPPAPGAPGFACSVIPGPDHTLHRLIWPEEEQPLAYRHRDEYAPGFRDRLDLAAGQTLTVTARLVFAPATPPRTAWRRFLDVAWSDSMEPGRQRGGVPPAPARSPAALWELAIAFTQRTLWAEEGIFRGFSIGVLWDGRRWQQRQHYKYEIGWAGQNGSLACGLLAHHLLTRDPLSRARGLAALDCWATHAPLPGGLFRCVFDPILGDRRRPEVQDACNLGNAVETLLEGAALARRCGAERPVYRDVALGICDFVMARQQPDGGFAKAWDNDGQCLDAEGTIGAYLVPALIAAHHDTRAPRYLAAARRAFEFYMQGLYDTGYTTAGALDTHCIDKESAFPLIEGGLGLYGLTGEERYLRDAEHASYYTASWQWHYTRPFPAGSPLAALGYDTFGGTAVSTQHHHLDPYAVRLLPAWLRLATLTGRPVWRERALAAWHNGAQGISDGDLTLLGATLPQGGQCEGYFHTRWGEPDGVSLWPVSWPSAFRLEALRRLSDWSVLEQEGGANRPA